MKKILSLFVLMAALSSCEDDVRFNNPAVQGYKDNEVWRADSFSAIIGSDQSLTVVANTGFETLTLRADDYIPGTYDLGGSSPSTAAFEFNADGILEEYTTEDEAAGGEITISANPTETDLTKGFITGTFKFLSVDSQGNELSFQRGHFYRIPITTAP